MNSSENIPQADLSDCEREPIHIPGTIQPHGFLLAARGIDALISHTSENSRTLAGTGAAVLGRTWEQALGVSNARALRRALDDPSFTVNPLSLASGWSPSSDASPVTLIAHTRGGFIIVEGEYAVDDALHAGLEGHELPPLLARMGKTSSATELCVLAAEETRRLTAFDRVLIYQFDADWNGTVIAESRNDVLPAYLNHRFPAFDIPKQARDLYHINRLRLIASNDYQPVRLLAVSSELPPLDLTLSTLRGISPIHLEYMRNMGTGSSMSASIMRDGKLWGLLSCHGREPRNLSFATRSVCDLLAQILSMQLAAREQSDQLARQVQLRKVLTDLLAHMTDAVDFTTALDSSHMLELTGAHGSALVREGEIIRYGITPPDDAILKLRDWVGPRITGGLFQTNELPFVYPEIGDDASVAGGLLAISISPVEQCYILWFRAELVTTVLWSGEPHKLPSSGTDTLRMHPRKSFDTWKETVRGRSSPWLQAELEAAMIFRSAVVDIVLKQAAAKSHLLTEVQRMNKELEAFAYTVSHDLRAPFRHVRGYAELLQMDKSELLDDEGRFLLQKILKSTAYAGNLVDTLLSFSRMNLTPLNTEPVDLNDLVETARSHAMINAEARSIDWHIAPLPRVNGDANLLLLALQNLFENAVKYTSKRNHAVIEVSAVETNHECIVTIKDNGAGFDMKYADKLFGVFQRLHTSDQFTGLGIGLASVRRIIERHGGRVWAESRQDEYAVFHLSLPVISSKTSSHHA
ncbi:ATP-binding protein [Rariglobus hedericola]|uniref:ATP-binding protein n=1 Tax=Rariglobus hedericola TaxID=2597822 RepID=UPI001396AA81|nr:ATP-binding protein [Rariglobus hedericola]